MPHASCLTCQRLLLSGAHVCVVCACVNTVCVCQQASDCFAAEYGGNSLLIEATKRDATSIVVFLLDQNADINFQNVHGDTAAIVASRLGRTIILLHLLLAGADLTKVNGFGENAKSVATQDILELLKQYRINPGGVSVNNMQLASGSLSQDAMEISAAGSESSPFAGYGGPQYNFEKKVEEDLTRLRETGRLLQSPVGPRWGGTIGGGGKFVARRIACRQSPHPAPQS